MDLAFKKGESDMKNIKEYGVIADAQTIQTTAVQSAIDDCAKNGKTLVFEKGKYICGTLTLRDNSHIVLEEGAVIFGSEDTRDYPENEVSFVDAVGRKRGECLVLIAKVNNVIIEGSGVICGNGAVFQGERDEVRPFLMRVVEAENVKLKGISLTDAGAWCLHINKSSHVDIDGIKIHSDVNANNDGIDIDSSSYISIKNCDIVSGDDGICIKATTLLPCEYIDVSDCRVSSNWGCFKIGTESVGDVSHVKVQNCLFYDNIGGGIKIVPTDGMNLSDVYISDIEMKNATGPIFVGLGERLRRYAGIGRDTLSTIKDVTIRNIKADVYRAPERGLYLGEVWGDSIGGIIISGTEKNPIENLTLENIEVSLPGGVTKYEEHEVKPIGERYPEFHVLDPVPAKGIYARYTNNSVFKNISLTFKEDDVREVIFTEKCENIDFI